MTEYFIQKKYLGRPARTIVKTRDDKSVFLLVGTWGPKGDVLTVYSMEGEFLAAVKKVPWSFGSRFDLYQGYEKAGTMNKIFSWRFDFYYIAQLGWHVTGNVFDHQYTIRTFTRPVMTMTTGIDVRGDYYQLDIPQDNEAPLAICIASVLDYWVYENQKQKNFNFSPELW
ncbi:LURP-one-related/scramblase family protein [Enterococcus timonensis]|uniref:LURP-one-related/scramblase family protein n=1 Tax=Enterococcus timonensis TaxID=1852364 RepID=UPI0008DA56BF|nr:hypothetical protein [Enterococcus timonensis]